MEIRLAQPSDAQAIAEIYRPYVESTAITFEITAPSSEEIERRISEVSKNYPWLVAIEDDEVVAYCYASALRKRPAYLWSVETSIYVKQGCHSKGIGTALYEHLEELLVKQGITNLYACIAHNEAADEYLGHGSVMFHAKKGYTQVGAFKDCANKFNRWYGIVWMEKCIAEHGECAAFTPYSKLQI